MTTLAIKAQPIQAAPPWKRQVLKYAIQKQLLLGEPAIFTDGTDRVVRVR